METSSNTGPGRATYSAKELVARPPVRWAYPGKSYFDHGVIAAAGSDVSVTPMSPWWGLWAAVERKELVSGQVLAPEERLTVMQALELFTRNPAYIAFEEKDKGSLETGKLATSL